MTSIAVPVRTSAQGLVFMELRPSAQFRHELSIGNGVHDVAFEFPFQLLFANFTAKSRTLPKGTTIAYAKRSPLAVLAPNKEMAQGLEAALHITEQTPATGECVLSRKNSSPVSLST